ncbi:unnamed protein product [Cyclocybe aegerita]|uniref:Uncharacterized protein n=1 Tax=Cyclocybe aegerita TaxID=1973307 RepID=A0A8S0WK05_CYCAE|nr:unnamed protein product [Cyclocybe aegerita]
MSSPMGLSSSAPDLPQEIQDLCIDELAFDKDFRSLAESLRSCLLVSRSFYQRSRRHLWSSVDLELKDDERSRQKVSKLLDLMDYVPPAYPPTFTVIGAFVLDTDSPSPLAAERERILGHPALAKALVKLHESPHGPSYFRFAAGVDWNSLSEDLQTSLRVAFRSPKLIHLCLEGLLFLPITVLDGCVMKSLETYGCGPTLFDHAAPVRPSSNPKEFMVSPPQLNTMWTDQTFILPTSKSMSHAFKYQQSDKPPPSPLASLKNLLVSIRSLSYSIMVRDLLEDASHSLDYLKLDFDPRVPITPYAPALVLLHNLTHLAIELIPMKDPISLTPFVEMLKLSLPDTLREMELGIAFTTSRPFQDRLSSEKEAWKGIDSVLSQERYKGLREFEVSLFAYLSPTDVESVDKEGFEAEVYPLFASELLPTLFSSKYLKASLSAQIGQAW